MGIHEQDTLVTVNDPSVVGVVGSNDCLVIIHRRGGLPLTKRLVELHGATLAIHSEVGVGTTVSIVLPKERALAERQVA